MTTMVLATFGTTVVTILLVGVSLMLMGLVLLQKNRGSGLSGAFGGVGGHTAFGTKTGDFLTWVTVGFTALFLLLSVVGVYVFEPSRTPIAPAQGVSAEPGTDAGGAVEETTLPATNVPATDAAPAGTGQPAPVDPGAAAPAQPAEPAAGSTTPPPDSGGE